MANLILIVVTTIILTGCGLPKYNLESDCPAYCHMQDDQKAVGYIGSRRICLCHP